MKVYVVMRHYDYEGSELLDIFDSPEKAESYAQEESKGYPKYSSVSIDVHEKEVK